MRTAVASGLAFLVMGYASLLPLQAASVTGRNVLKHCKWSGPYARITVRDTPLHHAPFGHEIGFVGPARQFLVREAAGDGQSEGWLALLDIVTGETVGWIPGVSLITLHDIARCRF